MSTQPEDIEIYIKDVQLEDCLAWLKQVFKSVEITNENKSGFRGNCLYCDHQNQEHQIPIQVMHKAVGKFTCLWFNYPTTPWESDQACARDAFQQFQKNVRCTPGSWQADQDPDLWWQISPEGEGEIIWKG